MQPVTLVWFRRDLRLHDHATLATALAEREAILPIFVFDTDILARFTNPADRRLTFIMEALVGMHDQLRKWGGGMLVLHGDAREALPRMAEAVGACRIVSAEDFEPATRARDAEVAGNFNGPFVQVLDHLLRSPRQILKEDGTPFKMFTPYYKRWIASLTEMDGGCYEVQAAGRCASIEDARQATRQAGLKLVDLSHGAGHALEQIGYRHVEEPLWKAEIGQELLADFAGRGMSRYAKHRDFMGKRGTSRLGTYLRHGLVSIRECYRTARETDQSATWIKELAWREFYAMILFHWPEVVTQEFQPQYRNAIPWDDSATVKQALEQARTGYPIIDAALREILTTGWMHNRARMIVASFFTKDLLMDWRRGEEFFAQHLMDYELASNNGGWQWSASTGTDAQPYFRVFNPVLQSRKFDPTGEYIRFYLPELKDVPDKFIHWPHGTLCMPAAYWPPIVDHADAKRRAIEMFKSAARAGAAN